MEYLLVFLVPKGAPPPPAEGMADMGKLAAELASEKVLKRGAPLAHEAHAATVCVRKGKPLVIDGPFAESKEVIAGFWVVDVPDRAAAIAIAERSPHARGATTQVHRILFRGAFGDTEAAKPFLLLFRMEPGPGDPEARGREMRAFGEELVRAGTLFETARLADQERPVRVEVRAGRPLITDGPFAESKEVIGGYGLVRAASRAEAIELAGRFPHACWGPIEVREVLFFDRV